MILCISEAAAAIRDASSPVNIAQRKNKKPTPKRATPKVTTPKNGTPTLFINYLFIM